MNALQLYQIIRFSTTLLIGILLIRFFGLSTTEVSIYEILLFLGNFMSFFWLSAGQKGLLTLFPSSAKPQKGVLLFNLFLLLFGLAAIAAGLLYFGQALLVEQLTTYQSLPYISLIAWYLLFNTPAQIIEYIYVLKKQDRPLIIYGIIIHFLQLMAIVFPISIGMGLEGVFQGLVLWSLLKFIWLWTLLYQYSSFELDKSLQKKVLLIMLPLSLHALLGGGMEYVDGFIVSSHFEEEKMFALFRYGARELPIVSILVAALVATMIPLAVEKESQAITNIKQKIYQLSNWLYPITIVLMVLSPFLFPFVYNEEFSLSAKIFNIYLLVISSRILLPQVLIYSRQHNYVLVASAIIELIINLSLSLYWVQVYGLEGIAFATVVAYMVNKVLLMGYVHFKMGISVSQYLPLKNYILWNLLLVGVFILTYSF